MEQVEIRVDTCYIGELQRKYSDLVFRRIEPVEGLYYTNPSMKNSDSRIFTETQVKRVLRGSLSPLIPAAVKNKLAYFSQKEDKNLNNVYQFSVAQDLQPQERYAIHNIGHATQLIQVSGFNILTDPVFGTLNTFLYPALTESYPGIKDLPSIDVILVSHNHRDHVDEPSLQVFLELKRPQPIVLVPFGDKQLFKNLGFNKVHEVEWFTEISLKKVILGVYKNVSFVSIPADHRSGRFALDNYHSLVTSWIINPKADNVVIKFSGDTRSLTRVNQKAVDAVLWSEIESKSVLHHEIPDVICLEPSGPNYTRCDMDTTHQSTSYSVLLKFLEAENLAQVSGRNRREFLQKIKTVMMHHNKFELGPDRFNEGLFIAKKLVKYLDKGDEEALCNELKRQKGKLEMDLDKKKLKSATWFTTRPIISTLGAQTSLLVHAKDFIIEEIYQVLEQLPDISKQEIKSYVIANTVFPKIGERLNDQQLMEAHFDVNSVQKYNRN